MRTSPAGIALIKLFEGCKLRAYRCPAGVWTIGYGHTGSDVHPGLIVSQDRADDLLVLDLIRFEKAVAKAVAVPLSQNQFDALVALTYNTGPAPLTATLGRVLNARRYNDVPAQFMRWTRAGGKELKGLVRRRRAECALWRGLDDDRGDDVEVAGPITAAPAGRSLTSSTTAKAAGLAGAGGIGLVGQGLAQAKEHASTFSSIASAFDGLGSTGLLVLGAVILAGAGYLVYVRWRDRALYQ